MVNQDSCWILNWEPVAHTGIHHWTQPQQTQTIFGHTNIMTKMTMWSTRAVVDLPLGVLWIPQSICTELSTWKTQKNLGHTHHSNCHTQHVNSQSIQCPKNFWTQCCPNGLCSFWSRWHFAQKQMTNEHIWHWWCPIHGWPQVLSCPRLGAYEKMSRFWWNLMPMLGSIRKPFLLCLFCH